MSLGVRKWIIVVLVLSVFLLGNILLIANWLIDTGVCDWAHFVRTRVFNWDWWFWFVLGVVIYLRGFLLLL